MDDSEQTRGQLGLPTGTSNHESAVQGSLPDFIGRVLGFRTPRKVSTEASDRTTDSPAGDPTPFELSGPTSVVRDIDIIQRPQKPSGLEEGNAEEPQLWSLMEGLQLAFEPHDDAPDPRRSPTGTFDKAPQPSKVVLRNGEDIGLSDWGKTLGSLDIFTDSLEQIESTTETAVAAWLEGIREQDFVVTSDDLHELQACLDGGSGDEDAREMIARTLISLGFHLAFTDGHEENSSFAAYNFEDLAVAILCSVPEPFRHPGHVPKRHWGSLDEDRAFAELRRTWIALFSSLASDPAAMLSIVKAARSHLDGELVSFSAIEFDRRRRPEEMERFAQAVSNLCDYLRVGYQPDRDAILKRVEVLRQLDVQTAFLEDLVGPNGDPAIRDDVRGTVLQGLDRIRTIEHRLLMMHAGHVLRLAERQANRGLETDDLFQIGFMGLMRSIRTFDPDKGLRLQAYAANWIRQCMSRAIIDLSSQVRLPAHQASLMRDIDLVRSKLEDHLLRKPHTEEIAEKLGVKVEQVALLLAVPREYVDYEEITDEPDEGSEADQLVALQSSQLATVVENMLQKLPERQAYILRRRYGLDGGEPMTLEELGQIEGVTRERIRQIEAKALDWLRHPERKRLLERVS